MPKAYPLQWPAGVERTPADQRRHAQFSSMGQRLDLRMAVHRLREQLRLMKVFDSYTLSCSLRRDAAGVFAAEEYSKEPGVAVYFDHNGYPYCFPCDKWVRLADNIGAIAAHLEAMRAMERYGVGETKQAFAGYLSLPAPEPEPDWWDVLGVQQDAPIEVARAAHKALAIKHHPDKGGSVAAMARINVALQKAEGAQP